MNLKRALALACAAVAAVALTGGAAMVIADVQPALAKAKKQTITVGNKKLSSLTYTAKTVSLKAKAKTTLSYKSSKTKVATVSKKGKLTLKKAGTVKITITAKATKKYKAAKKTVTVKVVRAKQTITTPTYNERLLGDAAFVLETGVVDSPAMTFSSSNPSIATVSKKGKVKLGGGIGRTVVIITAAKTPRYKAATKQVTIRVTRYLFMFEQSKNLGTFPLSRLLTGLTGQRKPKIDGLHECDELTPQGACVDSNRLYLTAYCKFHDGGATRHNSILHIMDKSKLTSIKTIVLPSTGDNHAGGVTVDDAGNVWVAGASAMNVLLIKKETLDALLADTSSDTVVLEKYDNKKIMSTQGGSVSFVEYADGMLWVGYYVHNAASKVYAYAVESDETGPVGIALQGTYTVASDANGVSVFTRGGVRYLAVSRQPNGRNGYSEILFYADGGIADGAGALALVGGASFPCQLEEVDFDADMRLFAVYESAAKSYRTGSDGGGVANEVVEYGTVGDGLAIFEAALGMGPR